MSAEKNLATKQMLILINFPLEVGRDTSTLFVISSEEKSEKSLKYPVRFEVWKWQSCSFLSKLHLNFLTF